MELGFGELPEIVLAGEPGVATVMLEDKGLVELKVSFGQAEYQIREGQQANIEVKVAPTADRRVEVPLLVAPIGGATDEDYSGVPAKVVFEEGESEGTISVEVLADEVNDPGEGVVLSFGELPEAGQWRRDLADNSELQASAHGGAVLANAGGGAGGDGAVDGGECADGHSGSL